MNKRGLKNIKNIWKMRKKGTKVKNVECAMEYGRQVLKKRKQKRPNWLDDVESIYYYLLVAKAILCTYVQCIR
jgi:hypothetical protein